MSIRGERLMVLGYTPIVRAITILHWKDSSPRTLSARDEGTMNYLFKGIAP